jgi:hypothetical protein
MENEMIVTCVALVEEEVNSNGWLYPKGSLKNAFPDTLPVYFGNDDNKMKVGSAMMTYQSGRVFATITTHNPKAKELIAEKIAYATPFGTGKAVTNNGENFKRITNYTPDGISLSDNHSMKSIRPLGERVDLRLPDSLADNPVAKAAHALTMPGPLDRTNKRLESEVDSRRIELFRQLGYESKSQMRRIEHMQQGQKVILKKAAEGTESNKKDEFHKKRTKEFQAKLEEGVPPATMEQLKNALDIAEDQNEQLLGIVRKLKSAISANHRYNMSIGSEKSYPLSEVHNTNVTLIAELEDLFD